MAGLVVYLVIGMLAYHWFEGWTLYQGFEFACVTITTVGYACWIAVYVCSSMHTCPPRYGNIAPTHPGSRVFTCFYILIGFADRALLLLTSCPSTHLISLRLNLLAIGVGYVAAKIASEARADIKHVVFLSLDMSIHTKSLIVNIIVLVIVLIIGVVYYTVRSKLSVIDAAYMTVQTVTTGSEACCVIDFQC